MTLYLVFRSDAVQTLLVRMAADYLSGKTGTQIRIREFSLSPVHGLMIGGISVTDRQHAVLLSADVLGVRPGIISISNRKLNISQVLLRKGVVQLLIHKGDSVMNLQQILGFFASSDTTTKTDTTPSAPWNLSVSSVRIEDTRFHIQDENEPPVPSGMDFSNIDASGINLEINDIAIDGDTINAHIAHLAARERSGIMLHELSGKFQVSSRFLKAHELKIRTSHSDLALDFQFLYDSWEGYNDFLEQVHIKADILPSELDMQDIGYFAPELAVMKDRVKLSGSVRGTVSNFRATDLRLAYGSMTRFFGNITATGLPDVERTYTDMDIRTLVTSHDDLESILLPGDGARMSLPVMVANLGRISLKGRFTGFYNDFTTHAEVSTALGNLTADLAVKRPQQGNAVSYQGRIEADHIEAGMLTGSPEMLGLVSLRGSVSGAGLSVDKARLSVNVSIDSAFVNGYNYHSLEMEGRLGDKTFTGLFTARDPNLDLDFDGQVDLHDSIPEFNFVARVNHAQLFRLNLLRRDSTENLRTCIEAKLKGNTADNIDGSLLLDNTEYEEGGKSLSMDRLSLKTTQDTVAGKSYHLQSDYLDADLTGRFSFGSVIPTLAAYVNNYLVSFNLNDSLIAVGRSEQTQRFDLTARFKGSDEVTAIFLPFLKVSPATELDIHFDDSEGALRIKGHSPAMFIKNVELSNWSLDAAGKSDQLTVSTGAETVYLKRASKDDSLEVKVDTLRVAVKVLDDSIRYNVSWLAGSKPSRFSGFANFRNSPYIEMRLTDFNVRLNEQYWTVDPQNFVRFDTTAWDVKELVFRSGDQSLRAHGRLSDATGDTLDLGFNKLDISRVDQLLKGGQVDVDGSLNGHLRMTRPQGDFKVLADLRLDKFKFNKELLGDATFKVSYDPTGERIDVLSQILYTGNAGTNIPFSLSGTYHTAAANPAFNFDLKLKNLNLKMFSPFVADFMTIVGGQATGQVTLQGNPTRPKIGGALQLSRTEFKINYLNVPYSFADVVKIDSNAFIFDKITMYDSLGNKAMLNGRITHNLFSDLRLDLHIDMEDFSAFSNSRAANSLFYGKARASGTASITGPTDDIQINVKAASGGKTHVVVPIDLTRSVGQADYIIFNDPGNDTAENVGNRPEVSSSGLSLDLGLRINQDAEVEVYFPDQLGNLKASGTGNLLMKMTPSTPFSMSGTYTLAKGSFLFQFKNLLRLPMSIREGSIINWTGDPADANISLSAIYKTKAPMAGITTNPEKEGIRIPVECVVRLRGKLMNPEIAFSILLPNVEESLKSEVYASIDTNNSTTVAEQTIYLMVMNQFKPVVANSGGVDVSATSMSLVTNQINSMLSQMSSNVNVNMNYKPATGSTQQEFDVGISTQLLDDRLLIDGTFGMNSYSNSSVQQTSTIVGDINIEYILTENRRWRVRAFNRTNTLNILNNNAPYTQGVGIKFQRDFSTFGELFRPSKYGTEKKKSK